MKNSIKETIEEYAERRAKGTGSDNWEEIKEGIIEGYEFAIIDNKNVGLEIIKKIASKIKSETKKNGSFSADSEKMNKILEL